MFTRIRKRSISSIILLSVLVTGCNYTPGKTDVVSIPQIADRRLYCLEHNYPENDFSCKDGRYYDETGREVLFSDTVFEDTDTHFEVNDYYFVSFLKEQDYLEKSREIVERYGCRLADYTDDGYRFHRPLWELSEIDCNSTDIDKLTDMAYELLTAVKVPYYRAPQVQENEKQEIKIVSWGNVTGINMPVKVSFDEGEITYVTESIELGFNLGRKSRDELKKIITAHIDHAKTASQGRSVSRGDKTISWMSLMDYDGTSVSTGNNSFMIPSGMKLGDDGAYRFDSSDSCSITVEKVKDDNDSPDKSYEAVKAEWKKHIEANNGSYMQSGREDLGAYDAKFYAECPSHWFRIYEQDGTEILTTYIWLDGEYVAVKLTMKDFDPRYEEAYQQIRYSFR